MASSPNRQHDHQLHPHQKQQLYPIRVDVTSNDRQLRLVDTLLWDPSIIPAEPEQLALDIVRDAVVLGMGRAARHFTNRLEISETVELQEKVSKQLADQFQVMREIEAMVPQAAAAAAAPTALNSNIQKKRKREDETAPPGDSSSSITAMEKDASSGSAVKEEDNSSKQKTEDNATKEKDPTLPVAPSKHLIPIHLRLSVHGVRIHDEFNYDPEVLSPLQVAQSIATDLKLSQEMVVSIAIEIAEQVAAAAGPPLVLPDHCQVVEEDEGGPQERRNLTAAWMLQNRVHVTNVAHLVAQHRPMEPKK